MSPTPETINVWIIEDNLAFSRNASAAINVADGLRCTLAFRSCEEALKSLKTADPPQVVLMDIGLPGMSGIEGIVRLRESAPGAEVVVLTVFEDEDKLFQAICAGASGYLLKGANLDEIADAIRLAHAGGSPMTPRIARRVLGFFKERSARQADYGLTDRERDILQLLVEGLVKKEIASRLGISFHTVDMHLRHIYEKLQVNTATGAVAKAVRERLV
jgi:DNA-binding NarL/FixJ family response regulator